MLSRFEKPLQIEIGITILFNDEFSIKISLAYRLLVVKGSIEPRKVDLLEY
jgi:hypothetical protein